ncbi:MAG: RNA 2'-phosphotransferase, partial [Thermodesulfobacteriota bacterium]
MGRQAPAEQLAKLCEYVLGRRPDEFGLVLDENGFVKIKEFLKAVSETEGWSHIKRSHIHEMLLVCRQPPVEVADEQIRAKDRGHLPERRYCPDPPKMLYTCVRQKAYPVLLGKGIYPTFQAEIICAESREMAERIGKRRSAKPVELTIHSGKAAEQGVRFFQAGEGLY